MSTLSHLYCHSSKCVKGSGYSVMKRREKIGEKARTKGVGDRGGISSQGNDENFKAIFCYIPGVVKGPDDVAVNRTEQT